MTKSFEERKVMNSKLVRKRNSELQAGSPLYYYCRLCGAEMMEPESHQYPAPRLCADCKAEGRKEPK